MKKLYWVGKKLELRTKVEINQVTSEEDWVFTFIRTSDGKLQMAVF